MDHAHHFNMAQVALRDTVALSDAVQRAMDMTSEDDPLIVLTADHSHPFTMSGYPRIDTDIIGKWLQHIFVECVFFLFESKHDFTHQDHDIAQCQYMYNTCMQLQLSQSVM